MILIVRDPYGKRSASTEDPCRFPKEVFRKVNIFKTILAIDFGNRAVRCKLLPFSDVSYDFLPKVIRININPPLHPIYRPAAKIDLHFSLRCLYRNDRES